MAEEEQTSPPEPSQEPAQAGAEAAATPAARPRPGQAPAIPVGDREPPKPEAETLATALAEVWEGIAYQQKFNFSDLEVTVQPADLLEACRRCKEHPALSFDYLMCITGTDYESFIEVVYHLYSYRDHRKLTVRTPLNHDKPSVSSVVSVWKGANWHEREAAEMLAIDFPGHPNLVPLLLEEGLEEHPLLKSHPLVPIYADRPGVVERPDGD